MTEVDLHTHTIYSDGYLSVEQLLDHAKSKGIKVLAITDHDTLSYSNEIQKRANTKGITLIPGMELSCYNYQVNKKVHIVALFKEGNIHQTLKLGKQVLEARDRYHQKLIHQLNKHGYEITYEEAKGLSKSGYVFKKHVYDTLKNHYDQIDDTFYQTHFRTSTIESDLEMNYIPVKDAIEAIHNDGGIAILAHPQEYDSYDEVEVYASYGLDGIEVSHSRMSVEESQRAVLLAYKYQLIQSGGSDFHKLNANLESVMGHYGITLKQLDIIKSKIEQYQK